MFKVFRKVIRHVPRKGGSTHLTVYLPKEVRDVYLRKLEEGFQGQFVVIYGNEKNGIMVVAPATADGLIRKVGIRNIGMLIEEGATGESETG